MPRLTPLFLPFGFALLVAGCQPEPAATANPITGQEIKTVVLDTNPMARPVLPDPETMPQTAKSDMQLACERKKGQWAKVTGTVHTCIFTTKDAGKSCSRESQCEGACLARSGTCSPIKPLLGCNEILQDNGARVTLCIN